jgi:hypothetical protein
MLISPLQNAVQSDVSEIGVTKNNVRSWVWKRQKINKNYIHTSFYVGSVLDVISLKKNTDWKENAKENDGI